MARLYVVDDREMSVNEAGEECALHGKESRVFAMCDGKSLGEVSLSGGVA